MRTWNQITVRAPWRRVFEIAQNVEDWPRILSHYRWVRVHSARRRKGILERDVSMAAHRTGFPVRWRSLQKVRPKAKEIYYYHTRSLWTKGMHVWWRFKPNGRNSVTVTIEHALEKSGPLRSLFYQKVVSDLFIHHVADRTLRGVAGKAENRGR